MTEGGFFHFHGILQNINWDFLKDNDKDVNFLFSMLHQTFVDAFEIAFPLKHFTETELLRVHWFTDELRHMREELQLVAEMFFKFKTDNLRLLRNRLRQNYKAEVNRAKVAANDALIANSSNKCKTMWKMINSKRNMSGKNNIDKNITPDIFNDYFCSTPHILVNSINHVNDVKEHFLKKIPNNIGFRFEEVSYIQVRDVILSLKNCRSRDFYGLSVSLIKKKCRYYCFPNDSNDK